MTRVLRLLVKAVSSETFVPTRDIGVVKVGSDVNLADILSNCNYVVALPMDIIDSIPQLQY
jgi:hypothetical protein